ncbi:MAG TPA: DNA-directed RNA polymerase subunit alpha [Chloroflexota bacterium]|nr:DNA-directed RNA polymerase subunit alpha [Chloroflexota bacterium]
MLETNTPKVECIKSSENQGTFQIEPLEPGYGVTLGNALRRVLLSSLPGAAVTSIKIEGVYHEFATVPGVREDTTELILNVKKLRLKSYSDQPVQVRLQAKGPGVVTAADIVAPSDVEIVNPELYLATLDSADATLDVELVVEKGKGYLPSDGREAPSIGVIPVDAIFTPMRRVNYNVEHVRVGSRTDLDKLVIEITTDGTISATDALSESAHILVRYFSIFTELGQAGKRGERAVIGTRATVGKDYDRPIEDLDLSVRAYNCLKRSGITKVGQLLEMSEEDLLAVRNFGQKSLDELRARLEAMGYVAPGSERAEEAGEEGEGAAVREPSATADEDDEDEEDEPEGVANVDDDEPEEVEAGVDEDE